MLKKVILKVTKFQLATQKCFCTVVKNILGDYHSPPPPISIGSSNSQQKAMAKLLKFSQSWSYSNGGFSCWPLHLLDHLFLLKIPHYLSFRREDYRKLNRKLRKIPKFSTTICVSLGIEKVRIARIEYCVEKVRIARIEYCVEFL